MSAFSNIEKQFVDTLALLVLENGGSSEYRNGWFDGYSRAWIELTGRSSYDLINHVNQAIAGSGKELVR